MRNELEGVRNELEVAHSGREVGCSGPEEHAWQAVEGTQVEGNGQGLGEDTLEEEDSSL